MIHYFIIRLKTKIDVIPRGWFNKIESYVAVRLSSGRFATQCTQLLTGAGAAPLIAGVVRDELGPRGYGPYSPSGPRMLSHRPPWPLWPVRTDRRPSTPIKARRRIQSTRFDNPRQTSNPGPVSGQWWAGAIGAGPPLTRHRAIYTNLPGCFPWRSPQSTKV